MSESSELSTSDDDRRQSDSEGSSGAKKPAHKSKRIARRALSSSDDDSDEDRGGPTRKRTKASQKKPSRKRQRHETDSDDSDTESVKEGLTQLASVGVKLTSEEKEKFVQMTEKEREAFIFEKQEDAEANKQFAIAKKSLENKSGTAYDDSEENSDDEIGEVTVKKQKSAAKKPKKKASDDSDDYGNRERPSEIARKKEQKNALNDLINQRKKKEDRQKQNKLSVDQIFGKKNANDSDSSSSSSRSSAASSRSSSPSGARSDSENEEEPAKFVETLAELQQARLSRHRMSFFVNTPFFKKLAVDSFVRIGQLPPTAHGRVPHIGQVVDVVETAKTYMIANHRTNKGLRVRIGAKDVRTLRLEYISNQPFSEADFTEWMSFMKNTSAPLPTVDALQKKQKDISDVMNHSYTDADVDKIVAENRRFDNKTGNYAARKRQLLIDKERYDLAGDQDKAHQVSEELRDLEAKAEHLHRERQGAVIGIAQINKRNREHMKNAFLGEVKHFEIRREDDPFTRKNNRIRVTAGKSSNSGASVATSDSQNNSAPSSTSAQAEPAKLKLEKKSLFSVHSSIALDELDDIDLAPLPGVAPPPSVPTSSEPPRSGARLSFEEYKRRRQQQEAA